MGLASAIVRPARCLLVNLTTQESMPCLFNPTQFSEKMAVNWTRFNVLGLSFEPLQYKGTGNRQIPSVEFYLDKFFAAANTEGDPNILDFRSFIRSLTAPSESDDGLNAAPPRVLFLWPHVLVMEAVLSGDVEFQYRQFGADGDVLVYTATCSFEEVLDVRPTSESRRLP